jgi:hypothetical protein
MPNFEAALSREVSKRLLFIGKRIGGKGQIAIFKKGHSGHTLLCEFPGKCELQKN